LKHVYKTNSNSVAKLKMLRESSGRVRYLSDEEEARLMKALPAAKDRDPRGFDARAILARARR
jgi:hypothetical protein